MDPRSGHLRVGRGSPEEVGGKRERDRWTSQGVSLEVLARRGSSHYLEKKIEKIIDEFVWVELSGTYGPLSY